MAGPQSRWPIQLAIGETAADSDWCQRWHQRSPRWRHTSEGGFDPAQYVVRLITETAAKDFVRLHHYLASYPSALMRLGLFDLAQPPTPQDTVDRAREPGERRDPGRLVGVIVFGVSEHDAVLTNVFPHLRPNHESMELKRLVLLDEVPANAESWFTRRAIDRAAHRGVRGVVTFSDPLVRRNGAGEIVMPGHVGYVYQALNAMALGRTQRRPVWLMPDGKLYPERTGQKIRGGECGHKYAARLLAAYGAPELPPGASPDAFRETMFAVGARRVVHPGNWRFAWRVGCTSRERDAVAVSMPVPGFGYPKMVDELAV